MKLSVVDYEIKIPGRFPVTVPVKCDPSSIGAKPDSTLEPSKFISDGVSQFFFIRCIFL